MSDPLGLIGGASGARPLPMPGGGGGVGGSEGFGEALAKSLEEVNQAEQEAARRAEDLVTGKSSSVEDAVLAAQKADNAFRMLQALRNRMIEAYDELKQMRV